METDYSKHTYFRWKVKWWLEHLGALGTMDEKTPLRPLMTYARDGTRYICVVRFQLQSRDTLCNKHKKHLQVLVAAPWNSVHLQ